MKIRTIALVPAYEPDTKMLTLIDEFKTKGFEIVVVDDGSGADYEDIFEKAEQNAIVLSTFTGTLGMNSMLAKVLTEMLFFFISWTVQKYVIFYKGDKYEQGNESFNSIHDCT